MPNNNLYYQVRRLRNSKYKIEVELKNEKFNRSVDYIFSQDNILYLKKIIIFAMVKSQIKHLLKCTMPKF